MIWGFRKMARFEQFAACAALGAALVLVCSTANATTISGAIDLGYGYTKVSKGGGHMNNWNGSGTALVDFGNGMNLQVGSGGGRTTFSGVDVNTWKIDGAIFWRDWAGAFGASVNHHSFSGAFTPLGLGTSAKFTDYGVFGDYYMTEDITLSGAGGAFSGDVKGYYGGGGLTYYLMRNVAFTADGSYVKIRNGGGHATDFGAKLEYAPFARIPVSMYAGYDYTDLSGTSSKLHTFSVGFTVYFDGGAGDSLVDHHRKGVVGSITSPFSSLLR